MNGMVFHDSSSDADIFNKYWKIALKLHVSLYITDTHWGSSAPPPPWTDTHKPSENNVQCQSFIQTAKCTTVYWSWHQKYNQKYDQKAKLNHTAEPITDDLHSGRCTYCVTACRAEHGSGGRQQRQELSVATLVSRKIPPRIHHEQWEESLCHRLTNNTAIHINPATESL